MAADGGLREFEDVGKFANAETLMGLLLEQAEDAEADGIGEGFEEFDPGVGGAFRGERVTVRR